MAQGKPFVNINDIRDQIDLSNFDESFLTDYCGQGDYLIGVPCGINREEEHCTIQNFLNNMG